MPDALLALDGVTLRSPEGHRVFEGLSWRLARGGRFHLKGIRGGGATALLRLCCGIAEPEGGTVLLDGVPLAPRLRHPFLERGALGYVPSDGGLAVNMTLQDNVALPLRFALHQSRAEAACNARLWLERAGLLELAGLRPRVPADAQSWLASLARAAARQPELWLVDRPPGSLDEGQTQAALAILARSGEDPGVTMVLVGGDWLSGLGTALTIIESRVFTGGQP
jgi:ABC-type ATPase involved in cell division